MTDLCTNIIRSYMICMIHKKKVPDTFKHVCSWQKRFYHQGTSAKCNHPIPTPPLPSPSLDLRVCPWFQQLDLTVYYCCEVVSCAGTVPVLCVAVANTKRPCHEYLNWNMQWLCSGVKIQPIIWIQTQIYMVVCRLQIRLFFVCFVVVFNINFCWCNLMTPVVSMVIVRSV